MAGGAQCRYPDVNQRPSSRPQYHWISRITTLGALDLFLGHIRVKVGHTTDLPSRRKGYSKCNVAQTHLWLFCFHPRQRMATERMCHICFDMKDTRAYLVCSCNVEHQEYWWLQNIGGFGEVEACIRRVLDALGESDAPRWVAISSLSGGFGERLDNYSSGIIVDNVWILREEELLRLLEYTAHTSLPDPYSNLRRLRIHVGIMEETTDILRRTDPYAPAAAPEGVP
ncbi:hypothetical protein DFH07DRAFT_768885 [Mycena maculata]|uniref:Bacteriophage T5 Orf172 DNA-binding domain-containing protein n=1 Tax=Mycena maculata TaxID=230809 RepID=A0AAD7NP45_9AGAR|nr:hypothetical protein DFH07DRAFT_768885 [Mycena maculata]